MSVFSPVPTYRVADRGELLDAAMDLPFSPLKNLGEQFRGGVLDSFGLGTVLKDFQIPRSTDTSNQPPVPAFNPIDLAYEGIHSLFGAKPGGKTLSQDDWKASPYYREELPWDAGMTEDRAAALALFYDQRVARQFFGQKDMVTTLLGGFAGGGVDPVNFIPVFGPVARAAATARAGFIIGHALIGASEAAINTAAFGYLTAPQRAALGDDVSLETSINNIVFSAGAGLLFGGVGGAFARRAARVSARAAAAEREIAEATQTIRNLRDTRDVLNDATVSLATRGEVDLQPKSGAILDRIATDVADRRDAARALEVETRGITGDKSGEVVISASGARVRVQPEVVELATLQKATGALQVRDRSRQASDAWIEETATRLDPALLMPAINADKGAPLVGSDNIIDSGNGRTSAIARAYAAYPDRAAAYRKAIEDAGYSTEGMTQPVLINRRLTELSPDARAQFNADSQGDTARMSATELASMDRAALDESALALLKEGPITSAANRGFVDRFLANLPASERGSLVDERGIGLNADGQRRIENALVAAAYGDVDAMVVRKFAEATDDNTRSIVGAMADVAGAWVRMRRAAKSGEISAELDQTPELTEALRRLSGWREQAAREGRKVGMVIKEGMGQLDVFTGEIPAPVKAFIRAFYNDADFTAAAGRDKIAGRLFDLVDTSLETGVPDLLGEARAATKMGVLKDAFLNDLEADLLEIDGMATRAGTLGEAGAGRMAGPDRQGDQGRIGQGGSGRPGAIRQLMADRFAAGGRPRDEADAAGAMVEAFYHGLAQRAGTAVDDLVARFGLPEVRAADVAPEGALAQASSDEARAFGDALKDELGLRSLDLFVTSAGDLKINMIAVPRDKLGQGMGSKAMQRIVEFADARGMRITLTTGVKDAGFGTTSMGRLKSFYKRFGFVENKGRKKDFTTLDNMIREPRQSFDQSARPGNPAFDRWFSGSKVVDAEGKPLVVYHATGADFDAFNPTRGVTFLALTPDGAMKGAAGGSYDFQQSASADRIMPLYVRAEAIEHTQPPKPVVDEIAALPEEITEQRYNELREGRDGTFTRALSYAYSDGVERGGVWYLPKNMDNLFKPLEEVVRTGRDWQGQILPGYNTSLDADARMGARLKSRGFDATLINDESGVALVIADPTQIKSTFNRGTFDPNDPRILFQPAYHGTPHIFDKFDSSKIGTGEGAQAFGHGLYFAGRKEVAEYYRKSVSRNADQLKAIAAKHGIEGDAGEMLAFQFSQSNFHGKGFDGWLDDLKDSRDKGFVYPRTKEATDFIIEHSVEASDAVREMKSPGRLLTVDIPDDSELMVWDAPFSAQPEKVKAALESITLKEPANATAQQTAALADLKAAISGQKPSEKLKTAADFYGALGYALGSEPAASAALREAGIPGHRFLDQQSRPDYARVRELEADGARLEAAGDAEGAAGARSLAKSIRESMTHNYVIYDDSRVNVTGFEQQARGAIQFGDTGSIITLLKNADASTALHESSHHFLMMFKSMAEQADAPLEIARDWSVVKDWWGANADRVAADSPTEGVTGADVRAVLATGTSGDHVKDLAINVGLQEQWARGFERYAADGVAPTEGLRAVFAQFKDWLRRVYRALTDLRVDVSPEVKGVFDRLLGGGERQQEAFDLGEPPPRQPVDMTKPAPEPRPDGIDAAAARVSKPEEVKALAEQFGVKDDGTFAEEAEIEQMRATGRLTPEDEAALAFADQTAKDADAWAEALRAASACVMG